MNPETPKIEKWKAEVPMPVCVQISDILERAKDAGGTFASTDGTKVTELMDIAENALTPEAWAQVPDTYEAYGISFSKDAQRALLQKIVDQFRA